MSVANVDRLGISSSSQVTGITGPWIAESDPCTFGFRGRHLATKPSRWFTGRQTLAHAHCRY